MVTKYLIGWILASLAQLVEQLICNQSVVSSTLTAGSIIKKTRDTFTVSRFFIKSPTKQIIEHENVAKIELFVLQLG